MTQRTLDSTRRNTGCSRVRCAHKDTSRKTLSAHRTLGARGTLPAHRTRPAHISRACTDVSSLIRDDVHLAGVHNRDALYSARREPRTRAQT